MNDGEHLHDNKNPFGLHSHKKLFVCGVFALIIALAAYSLAQTALDTANINNVFEVVVNNTDLGYGGMLTGSNERHPFVTYWANNSPLDVYLVAHVVGTGGKETLEFNFSINGTVVQETLRDRTITTNLHEHFPMHVIVPKGANYTVMNNSNIFNVEWREYPILSGKNGTLSINQTVLGNSFNSTYDATTTAFNNNYSAQSFPNSSINGTIIRNNTIHYKVVSVTHDVSVTGTQAITGAGFKPSAAVVFATIDGVPGATSYGFTVEADGTGSIAKTNFADQSIASANLIHIIINQGVTEATAGLTTMDADGMTITWSKVGLPTGTATLKIMFQR